MALIYKGKTIATDKEGYLKDLDDWSEDIATLIADSDALVMNNAHWEIIHELRDFYSQYQLSPTMRALVKHVSNRLGKEKGSSIYLLKLFPGNPAKMAARIAGLPRPNNCL
jgi:tRNA 2-thiouridine synthesizing protein E